MTPRENMIKILRCDNPEWIPIVFYADPYNHPKPDSFPEPLAGFVAEKATRWDTRWETYKPVSDFLGINEFIYQAPAPYRRFLTNDAEENHYYEDGDYIGVIKTQSGEITERRHDGFILKPFIETPEDVAIFKEYVESWDYELLPDAIEAIGELKKNLGDNGIIQFFDNGTPLGMMYRVYSNIEKIVYLAEDEPEKINELFDAMENQYLRQMELMLTHAPEVDVIIGMDDTSSTLVSPKMFEYFNVALTDKRVETVEKYGKFYMHHSCGLLRHLLPVYRKSKMHGVHSFCRPPIGDITYSEGREILGDKICMCSGMLGGLYFPDRDTQIERTREVCEDAKSAGNMFLHLASPDPDHPVELIQISLEEARKILR